MSNRLYIPGIDIAPRKIDIGIEHNARILIAGADGQLGYELSRLFKYRGIDFLALGKQNLDITNRKQVSRVVKDYNPFTIINCAAYTNVDAAEKNKRRAFKINADGPVILKQAADSVGAFMIHISTDYVFGGAPTSEGIRPYRVTDKTSPVCIYGESKAAGEQNLITYNLETKNNEFNNTAIIRTSWLYSIHGTNFVKKIMELATDDKISLLRVVDDQIGCPTWAGSLAWFIESYLNLDPTPGLYHYCNLGVTSRYDLACMIVIKMIELGLLEESDAPEIEPIRSDNVKTIARRPNFSVLDTHDTSNTVTPVVFYEWVRGLEYFMFDQMGREIVSPQLCIGWDNPTKPLRCPPPP